MFGLPDTSIKEARERVRIAIKNEGIKLTGKKITINLAPAHQRKEGTFFDLPIAISVLLATEYIYEQDLSKTIFIGEISLDGKVKKVNGILPMCIEAKRLGIEQVILPRENAKEASIVKGLKIISVKNLNQVISILNGLEKISEEKYNIEEIFNQEIIYENDFSEVKGQEIAKRAIEVAAAGGHNIIMIGSPRFSEKQCWQEEYHQYYQI